MGARPIKAFRANADLMLVYDKEEDIVNAVVDLPSIAALPDVEGIVATARGDEYDFVSRVFAPQVGIDEDPVTGSAHTAFCAYWKDVLGKTEFTAKQLSARTGVLECKVEGDRVLISGYATLYMSGEIYI
jgi:predicted PhzF superfamily epimerase YddE/YHI9